MIPRTTLFYLKLVLLPLGVGCLLYWAAQEQMLRQSARWNWELNLGAALSVFAMAPLALRFKHALKVAGFTLDAKHSLRINALSAFYHFFVPLSLGAELTKFIQLKTALAERGAVRLTVAIVLDHVLGFVALLAILLTLCEEGGPLMGGVDVRWVAAAIVAAAAVLLALAWRYRSRLGASAREILERLMTHRADAAAAVGWSVAMQALMAAALVLPAQAWGLDIDYRELLFVLAASSLFAAVPLNIAGLGVAEIAGAGLYLAFGLSSRDALLLVSLQYCYRLLFAILGGLWDFAATRHPARVRDACAASRAALDRFGVDRGAAAGRHRRPRGLSE